MTMQQHSSVWIILAAALLIIFMPLPVNAEPVDRVIRVEAEDYAFSPAVIHANLNDRITIELVSKDVVHGLSIDGYPEINLQAEPGKPTQAAFVADRAGIFKIRCSVACGNLHPFMTGKIRIGTNLLFYRAAGLAMLVVVFGALQSSRKGGVSQ